MFCVSERTLEPVLPQHEYAKSLNLQSSNLLLIFLLSKTILEYDC